MGAARMAISSAASAHDRAVRPAAIARLASPISPAPYTLISGGSAARPDRAGACPGAALIVSTSRRRSLDFGTRQCHARRFRRSRRAARGCVSTHEPNHALRFADRAS